MAPKETPNYPMSRPHRWVKVTLAVAATLVLVAVGYYVVLPIIMIGMIFTEIANTPCQVIQAPNILPDASYRIETTICPGPGNRSYRVMITRNGKSEVVVFESEHDPVPKNIRQLGPNSFEIVVDPPFEGHESFNVTFDDFDRPLKRYNFDNGMPSN